jgi:hypothetical protein
MGLHERYFNSHQYGTQPSLCFGKGPNENEYTLMDAILPPPTPTPGGPTPTPGPAIYTHCDDTEVPIANTDVARMRAFWEQGTLGDWTATASGSTATYHWTDRAWAEESQKLKFQYFDTSLGVWATYATSEQIYDIGVHLDTQPRPAFTAQITRPNGIEPGQRHRACGAALHIRKENYYGAGAGLGPETCSPEVILN